jgi:hypothetical protein
MRPFGFMAWLLLLLLAPAHARAAPAARQAHFSVEKGRSEWTLRYTFSDESNHGRKVSVALPSAAVAKDNDTRLQFPKAAALRAQVAAVRRYAATHRGPDISAKAQDGGVSIRVRGKNAGRMREALEGARAAADASLSVYLARHRYTRLRGGGIVPDHARLADQYADDVLPLAEALAVDAPDARTFVARALAFTQAIPYEAGKNGADRGYRRPLSVLARNRGDCDSKSTLFLALVRARHPELAATVVYVPNHALAGVAMDPAAGERVFVREGVQYVAAEPVGPAKLKFGGVSGKAGWHLFWGSAETRALRQGTVLDEGDVPGDDPSEGEE